MSRSASLSIALGMLTILVVAPHATAKVPPETTYEACGESACKRAIQHNAGFALMAPAFRPRVGVPPAGARPWIRIDVGFEAVPGGPEARRALWALERPFPVVFVPDAGYVGRVNREGDYAWVRLRPKEARAYQRLASGLRSFPAQPLAALNPIAVANARPDALSAAGARGTERGDTRPGRAFLIVMLVAGISLAIGALVLPRLPRRHPRNRRKPI